VLILEDVTAGDAGWHFASRAAGPKGVQLSANPVAGPLPRGQGAPRQRRLRSWAVRADTVEFWQADPGRRHLRLRYTRSAAWARELLRP
jgi:Pyridoxine 5'-phosphate oxidase C-terminal dimerisation region